VILIRDIQAVVAAHHRVPVEAMRSPDDIGLFGGRDHSTVINGIRSAAKRLRNDGAAQDAMRIMVRKLLSVSA
jgi:hypothetical protein